MDNTLKLISLNTRVGKIRFSDIGEPLFMGTDVAKALKFKSHRYSVQKYCTQEKKLLVRWDDSMTMAVPCILIPLSDVRNLEQHADAAAVQDFEVILTNEILPKLRQVQKYEPETVQEAQETQEHGSLQVFTNESFGSVRTVMIDDEPWFAGKDVASALGYANTKDALATHVEEEDKRIIQRSEIATLENNIPKSVLPVEFVSGEIPNRGLTFVNESGVYSLVFGSHKPEAKAFKRWITHEVIPSIRKTGGYIANQQMQLPDFTNPSEAARAWADQFEKRELAERQVIEAEKRVEQSQKQIEAMKPKERFADAVAESDGLFSISSLPQYLSQYGVEKKQSEVFQYFFENGLLCKVRNRNSPTVKGRKTGFFRMSIFMAKDKDGKPLPIPNVKLTANGFQHYMEIFLNESSDTLGFES